MLYNLEFQNHPQEEKFDFKNGYYLLCIINTSREKIISVHAGDFRAIRIYDTNKNDNLLKVKYIIYLMIICQNYLMKKEFMI